MKRTTPALADAVLRSIEKLEETASPDDPAVIEIKRRALLRLSETQDAETRRRQRVLMVLPDHGVNTAARLSMRASMARRPTPDELTLLLSAAQNLEQLADPNCEAITLAGLKRIIEHHIAALEILRVMGHNEANDPGDDPSRPE